MKMPISVKFIVTVFIINLLIVFLLLCSLITVYASISTNNAFWVELQQMFFPGMLINSGDINPNKISLAIGMLSIELIALSLSLIFIYKFMYKSLLLMVLFKILISLFSYFSLVLYLIVLLFILFNKTTKVYLKRFNISKCELK